MIAQAYVADVTRPEERTRVYGLMGAAFGLGAIVGPVLGGGLSQFGYGVPFWVAAGISALTLAITWAFLPEPQPDARSAARGAKACGRPRRAGDPAAANTLRDHGPRLRAVRGQHRLYMQLSSARRRSWPG